MKKLRTLLTVSALAFASLSAQAEIVNVDDWWLQTDSLGGLRQSTTNPDFYFAVSQVITWLPSATYEAMDGYRVATTAEGEAVFNQGNTSGIHTYLNQGGWDQYTWEGGFRARFRFSDSNTTSAYKHVANYDEFHVQYDGRTENFAGMVMIKEPENAPSGSASLADVSAPMGIAALAFAGLMLMRRRQV
jgi:hypothetical protein